jgi:hypothetical protein
MWPSSDGRFDKSLLRIVVPKVGAIARDALHQPWFVAEIRAIRQMPCCKKMLSVLSSCFSQAFYVNCAKYSLNEVFPVAAVLLVGLGHPVCYSVWETRLIPLIELFTLHLPLYVAAINEYGWTSELLVQFIRGLSGVRVCLEKNSLPQRHQRQIMAILIEHARLEPADLQANFRSIGVAVVEAMGFVDKVEELNHWLEFIVAISNKALSANSPSVFEFFGLCVSRILSNSLRSGGVTVEVISFFSRKNLLPHMWSYVDVDAVRLSFSDLNATDAVQCNRVLFCA